MEARELLLTARRRSGLTQRELARRSGVPQPTISRIESAKMSPSLETLEPAILACGMELALVDRAGQGVDDSQIVERLRLSPGDRLASAAIAGRNVSRLRSRARPL
jgi:transcriptional regulator with XRE-family HTH domain